MGPQAEAQTGAAEEASGASRRRPKGGLGGLPQSGKAAAGLPPPPGQGRRGGGGLEAGAGGGASRPAPGLGVGGWGRLWRAEGKGVGSAEYPDRTDE